jgi:hypothetical protein
MKSAIATLLMLASIGSAMAADQYDAVYATDPAACEKTGEDMGQALFELQAAIVAPRVGIWMGELECKFNDVRMNPSPWRQVEEVYATARCYGPYLAFIDLVAITSDSSNINLAWGDQEGTPPAMVEILSMKHGESTDAERDPQDYAGVYTLCEGVTTEDLVP